MNFSISIRINLAFILTEFCCDIQILYTVCIVVGGKIRHAFCFYLNFFFYTYSNVSEIYDNIIQESM